MTYKAIIKNLVEFHAAGVAEAIIKRETGESVCIMPPFEPRAELKQDIDFGVSFEIRAELYPYDVELVGYVDKFAEVRVCSIWQITETGHRRIVWGAGGRANWDLIGLEEISK